MLTIGIDRLACRQRCFLLEFVGAYAERLAHLVARSSNEVLRIDRAVSIPGQEVDERQHEPVLGSDQDLLRRRHRPRQQRGAGAGESE